MNKKLLLSFAFSFLIFALAILGILIFCVKGFYEEDSPDNIPRFFYCVAFSFIGFSVLLFKLCFKFNASQWNSGRGYIIYYLFSYLTFIFALSSLAFSLLHLSEKTSSYLFYFLAAPISFTLAYLVDDYTNIVRGLAKKASKLD